MEKIQEIWEAYRWFNEHAVIDDVAALFGYATWVVTIAAGLGRALGLEMIWFAPLMTITMMARRKARRDTRR